MVKTEHLDQYSHIIGNLDESFEDAENNLPPGEEYASGDAKDRPSANDEYASGDESSAKNRRDFEDDDYTEEEGQVHRGNTEDDGDYDRCVDDGDCDPSVKYDENDDDVSMFLILSTRRLISGV